MTTININGETHEVETKPITFICHDGTSKISISDNDVLEIGPEQTVQCADLLSQEAWDAIRIMHPLPECWKLIFGDTPIPMVLKGEGLGYRHVVGLIILVVKVMSLGKQPFIRLPESYLHPKAQCGLADFFIYAQKGFKS